MDGIELKRMASRLYELAMRLYPDEFGEVYTAPREKFMSWMNEKTGLDCNHVKEKYKSIKAWLEVLEAINKHK